MDIFEMLQLGIEASIALAGFAGVIATYQTGEGNRLRRGNVAAVTVITRCSLLVGFACAMVILRVFVFVFTPLSLLPSPL